MKKGLNRAELTGLLLLVVLIAVITVLAVVMKDCGGESGSMLPSGADVDVVQPVNGSSEEDGVTGEGRVSRNPNYSPSTGRNNKKTGAGKKSGTRSSNRSSSSSKSSGAGKTVERPDPFLDTVPLEWNDWDDWEEPATPY